MIRKAPRRLSHGRIERVEPDAEVVVGRRMNASPVRVGGFGADITASGAQLVAALEQAIPQLDQDVQSDACSQWYDDACVGKVPVVDTLQSQLAAMEASGTTLTAANVLAAAGVDASDANIAAFGQCVKQREDASSTPRGTLAYCAISVRDSITPDSPLLPQAHTTQAFRDQWGVFLNSWSMFDSKYKTATSSALGDVPTEAEIASYLTQYSNFRSQFIDNGGTTTAPSIAEPWSITTTIAVFVGIAVVIYGGVKFLIWKYA